jgi:hypothetical protein
MKPKLIVTLALGAFVAATVVYLAFGRPDRSPAPKTARADGKTPETRLIVYYFHRTRRCPGCRNLEKLTRENLSARYAQQLASGVVELQTLNVEDKANEHFVTKYSILGSGLVLSIQSGGLEKTWKQLDRAFELKFETEAFAKYFEAEMDAFLKSLPGPKGS